MILLPNENPWHLATNHLRCITQGDNGYQRYNTMAERLAKTEGRMDLSAAMQLLSDVSQYSTQWSVVYGMTGKDVHVVLGRYYESVLAFRLEGRQISTARYATISPFSAPSPLIFPWLAMTASLLQETHFLLGP